MVPIDTINRYIETRESYKLAELTWFRDSLSCEHRVKRTPNSAAFCSLLPFNEHLQRRCNAYTCKRHHEEENKS